MAMSRDAVRILVYRQLKLEHPEYTEAKLQREVDVFVDLVQQIEEVYPNESYSLL